MRGTFARLTLGGLLLAALLSTGLMAHAQRTAITSLVFNPRSGMLEITHRFRLHDAEHAVGEIFGASADIIGSSETQKQFADYVVARFSLRTDTSETPLALTYVGHEVEGKFVWIYQEVAAPEAAALILSHSALQDIWPDQLNTVNVEGAFGVRSALLDTSQPVAEIKLSTDAH